MRHVFPLIILGLVAAPSPQKSIPSGTVLPVRLETSLSSKKSKPGQKIHARLMQDVPLPSGKIPEGARLRGTVLAAARPAPGSPAKISFQLDRLVSHGRSTKLATSVRAIASLVEIEEAQVPLEGPDRGTSSYAWTTVQVGGDVVYRGGGPVEGPNGPVGKPVAGGGVLAVLEPEPEKGCRGIVGGCGPSSLVGIFSASLRCVRLSKNKNCPCRKNGSARPDYAPSRRRGHIDSQRQRIAAAIGRRPLRHVICVFRARNFRAPAMKRSR